METNKMSDMKTEIKKFNSLKQKNKSIMNIKCITFDKQAQDALPEEIKAKMKADREKAIMDRQLKKMEALSMQDIGRVTLYRGKKEVSKEWVYGFLTVKPSYGNTQAYYIEYVEELYKDGKFKSLKHHSYSVRSETIGQFTGLKDKNGKKVHEGDILYYRYDDVLEDNGYGKVYYDVVFKDGAFGVMGEITNQFLPFSYNPITTEVVVGNIHDNPELLKDK